MTAPAAPVIVVHTTVGQEYIRWQSVLGAATYNVKVGGVTVASPSDDASGWNQYTRVADPGDVITVTAVNAGAEESAASNSITVAGLGTANHLVGTQPFG